MADMADMAETPDTPDTETTALGRIAEALDLDTDANVDEIVTAANRAQTPDPAKYVPLEAVTELLQRAGAKNAEIAEGRAVQTVDDAVKGGQLIPAMKDWGLALCRSDAAAFDASIEKGGAGLAYLREDSGLDARTQREVTPTFDHSGASGEVEDLVASQLGIDRKALR